MEDIITAASRQVLPWTKHGSEDCPYEDENACVDAWVAVHREQLDRFTEKALADLATELSEDYALDGEG